jgi:hypothetical protein
MFANTMGLAQAQQNQQNWQSRFDQQNEQFDIRQQTSENRFQADQAFKNKMFEREGQRFEGQLDQQRQSNLFREQSLDLQRQGLQERIRQSQAQEAIKIASLQQKAGPKPLSPSAAQSLAELESVAFNPAESEAARAEARSAISATGRPVFSGDLSPESRKAGFFGRAANFGAALLSPINPFGDTVAENIGQARTGFSGQDLRQEMSEVLGSIREMTAQEREFGTIPEALRRQRDVLVERYEELKGASEGRQRSANIIGQQPLSTMSALGGGGALSGLEGMFNRTATPAPIPSPQLAAGLDPSLGLF